MPKTPPYRIETARLVIRCWQPADAPLMQAATARNKEHLLPWMPWAKFEPQTVDEKVELCRSFRGRFDRDEDYVYAIFNRDETEVLGGTGLHPRVGPNGLELGYWVGFEHTQKGIATEATQVLTRVCLEYCEYDRLEIHCDPDNLPSRAIPEKLGFTHEVTRRRTLAGYLDGELKDRMIWTLFQHEYKDWPHRGFPIKAYDAAGRQVV